jgi:hypothetical protein
MTTAGNPTQEATSGKVQDMNRNQILLDLENSSNNYERLQTIRKALHILEHSKPQSDESGDLLKLRERALKLKRRSRTRSPARQLSYDQTPSSHGPSSTTIMRRNEMVKLLSDRFSKATSLFQARKAQSSMKLEVEFADTTKSTPVSCNKDEDDFDNTASRRKKSGVRAHRPHKGFRSMSPPRSKPYLKRNVHSSYPRVLADGFERIDFSMDLPPPPVTILSDSCEEDEQFLSGLLFLAPNNEAEIREILGTRSLAEKHHHNIVPKLA